MKYDLNKLVEWSKQNAVSFVATYFEASDELELKIFSPAKEECLYIKRVSTIENVIKEWELKIVAWH